MMSTVDPDENIEDPVSHLGSSGEDAGIDVDYLHDIFGVLEGIRDDLRAILNHLQAHE